MQLSDTPRQAPGVASRIIDGEAVLVHPGQRKVRVLNGVGARIWELASGERSLAAICGVIAAEYEIDRLTAETDAMRFCTDLVDRGLLTLNS